MRATAIVKSVNIFVSTKRYNRNLSIVYIQRTKTQIPLGKSFALPNLYYVYKRENVNITTTKICSLTTH